MGSTLEHGIYLPSEGEKNCYSGLAGNWNKVDGALGDIAELRQLIENKFTKEIVTELPTEDINPYCIYMILKTVPETDNIYDEWVYINNSWECLGNTKVDMTQYYTKQEVNQLPAVASGVTATKVGNYDAHIANGDIHVTANDKSKWTNSANTHVLRLAKSALTPSSSTNAFSNLDDSTALKVGDKVMDTAGVLFEVTAIDTANSTFTIGTALIDLAQDSDVVHKSGNETVSGSKTFSDDLTIYSSDTTAYAKYLNLKNQRVTRGSSETGTQGIQYQDKSNKTLTMLESRVVSNGNTSFNIISYNVDGNNQVVSDGVSVIKSSTTTNFAPTTDNAVTCGRALAKWSDVVTYKVNGLNPSSLSLPTGRNTRVDISSYFTNLGNGDTNFYSVSANGYIYMQLKDIATVHCFDFESLSTTVADYIQTFSRGNDGQLYVLFPVKKDHVFKSTWYTTTTVTMSGAYFIPCQGNV